MQVQSSPQRKKSIRVSTVMAAYKLDWVAVKAIEGHTVELKREVLFELNQVCNDIFLICNKYLYKSIFKNFYVVELVNVLCINEKQFCALDWSCDSECGERGFDAPGSTLMVPNGAKYPALPKTILSRHGTKLKLEKLLR